LTKLGVKLKSHKDSEQIEAGKDSSDSEKEEGNSEEEDAQAIARKANISLLDQHTELKRIAEGISFLIINTTIITSLLPSLSLRALCIFAC